jgi:hypothetical protein
MLYSLTAPLNKYKSVSYQRSENKPFRNGPETDTASRRFKETQSNLTIKTQEKFFILFFPALKPTSVTYDRTSAVE